MSRSRMFRPCQKESKDLTIALHIYSLTLAQSHLHSSESRRNCFSKATGLFIRTIMTGSTSEKDKSKAYEALGFIYMNGLNDGVKDYRLAKSCFKSALVLGSVQAKVHLERLNKLMDDEPVKVSEMLSTPGVW